jgi:replicative DNA helicase
MRMSSACWSALSNYETDEEAKQEVAGEAELIIAKQRNGPIGDVPLVFLREFTRFESRVKIKPI